MKKKKKVQELQKTPQGYCSARKISNAWTCKPRFAKSECDTTYTPEDRSALLRKEDVVS